MKRSLVLGIVPAAVVLMVAVSMAPATAKGPPEIVEGEFSFEDVNPCTGEEHEVTVGFTDRVHEFDNEAGNRHHANVHSVARTTTSDGFSGKVVVQFVDNGAGLFGEEEGKGMLVDRFSGVISNPDTGQRFRVHLNAHITVVDGVLIVDRDTFVAECLGLGRS